MSSENEVREASHKFYTALNRMANGEKNTMNDAWSHKSSVTAMHPIGGREIGWEKVNESFNQVAQIASQGTILLKDQSIQVSGNMSFEIGIEQLQKVIIAGEELNGEVRVTNIYQKEGETWKMIHHHSDTHSGMLEVLRRLQSK